MDPTAIVCLYFALESSNPTHTDQHYDALAFTEISWWTTLEWNSRVHKELFSLGFIELLVASSDYILQRMSKQLYSITASAAWISFWARLENGTPKWHSKAWCWDDPKHTLDTVNRHTSGLRILNMICQGFDAELKIIKMKDDRKVVSQFPGMKQPQRGRNSCVLLPPTPWLQDQAYRASRSDIERSLNFVSKNQNPKTKETVTSTMIAMDYHAH